MIGCACATADVNTTTPAMRITGLAQGVVAFFFNTIILALTINIGASLFWETETVMSTSQSSPLVRAAAPRGFPTAKARISPPPRR